MRSLFSTSFTFKWYFCVLLCGNVSIFSTLLSSVHVKADKNKPRRQRLCQSGWIIPKWSWCIYSFQNLQQKPSFPFPASKQLKEAHFKPFQPDTLLSVLGFHLWAFSSAPSDSGMAAKPSTDFPPYLTEKQKCLLFFLPHLIHLPE